LIGARVAAFFALETDNKEDRVIFCVKYSAFIHEVETTTESPFDNAREGRFTPPLLFDRIRAQADFLHYIPTRQRYSIEKE
jgi:hypothetical protein